MTGLWGNEKGAGCQAIEDYNVANNQCLFIRYKSKNALCTTYSPLSLNVTPISVNPL